MTENILELVEYGVAFGDRVILSSVNLEVPSKGNLVLLGPAGIGKSTLIRSICGVNYANPSFRSWGKALYMGKELREGVEGPALVSQNIKLMMATILENIVSELPERHTLQRYQQVDLAERLLKRAGLASLIDRLNDNVFDLPLGLQRHLAVLRTCAPNPKLICIDEPTTDVDDRYVEPLLQYIFDESKHRAVITILHNQKHAKRLKGKVALLSGGWINEVASDKSFYNKPRSKAGKQFVKTGSCNVLGPMYDDEALENIDRDSVELPPPLPEQATAYVSEYHGPRNFLWLKKGLLAGTPQPGLVSDLENDLAALQRVGVTKLITLLEKPLNPGPMKNYGIENFWFPIDDMQAPKIKDAIKWCKKVDRLMREGEVVAYHCKAGLGRTGTMLVAQLIWEGMDPLKALETARRIEPRWVQSSAQIAFLTDFGKALSESGTSRVVHG